MVGMACGRIHEPATTSTDDQAAEFDLAKQEQQIGDAELPVHSCEQLVLIKYLSSDGIN